MKIEKNKVIGLTIEDVIRELERGNFVHVNDATAFSPESIGGNYWSYDWCIKAAELVAKYYRNWEKVKEFLEEDVQDKAIGYDVWGNRVLLESDTILDYVNALERADVAQ